MRIALDASRAFKTPRTGTEYYAWEILRHVLQLPQARDHTWLCYVDRAISAAEQAAFLAQPPPNLHWEVLPWRRMWTHRVLGPAVRSAHVDVLFVPSHVIPAVLPPGRNPPTVVTVHDLGYRYWPAAHPLTQRIYLGLSTRWNLHAATHVISVSAATAQDIATLYGRPRGGLTVVHEAVTPAVRPSAAALAAVRARFQLPEEYAIFTGTLHPRKNVERLIRAYARLVESQGVNWPLVLAGGAGWQAERFRDLAQALGVAAGVRFPGYVADEDLAPLMAGARFLAFPSLFEGFGLPVLEAQGLGVPVMTSTYSSLPEVAGDAALYVDPTDVDALAAAMLQLSQDEALRARLIEAGFANVQRFSWEKAAVQTYAVLAQAAGVAVDPAGHASAGAE